MNELLINIHKSKKTVFSISEIALMFSGISPVSLKKRLNYLVGKGDLKSVRKGIYAKDGYNILEAANKIFKPSYISFQTILKQEGVIFQETNTIFIASYLSRKTQFGNYIFSYHKIPELVLTNEQGVEKKGEVFVATKERAFLDTVYIFKDYYFDNLSTLDWNVINEMKSMYGSKILLKRVNRYYKDYFEEEI
jgi:predicted transcriptional regulator of viral defense system